MQLFFIFEGLVALVAFVMAAPAERNQLEDQATTCISSYPAERTDTGANRKDSLFLRLFANSPELSKRNIGLRPDGAGVSIAVIDSTSPILAYQMHKGIIYSQYSDFTPAQNLGPVGGLRNITTKADKSATQAFIFRNNTADAGKSFKNSVDKWTLTGFSEGEYGLYSNTVTVGFVNGFMACKVQDYHQLFYYEYVSEPGNFPNCEFVGVQTIIAPVLPVD